MNYQRYNGVIPELASPKRFSVWLRSFIGNPVVFKSWIPAYAGMTVRSVFTQ
jgi:hypothetical protein